jgi:hypothetical protein
MRYLKVRIAILTVILSAAFAEVAAGMEPIKSDQIMFGIRAGHNAVFGNFSAVALQTQQILGDDFLLDAGVQYNTLGKIDLEARQSYDIHFDWGELLPEAMVAYSNFSSINSLAIGAGAKAYFGRLSAKLGYYYHFYGNQANMITEPFNIYYEFCVDILHKMESWALDLILTNCEPFELERHYQPSFIAECHHDFGKNLCLSLGVGYKPSGTFNISADYYQSFIKTGLCYRW